jgi:hypothetical protein
MRTRLPRLLLAVCIGSSILAPVALAVAPQGNVPTGHEVQLIEPTTAASVAAIQVDAALPGLRASQALRRGGLLISVVRNSSSHGILAFVVNWRVTHADGSVSLFQQAAMSEPESGGALSGQRVVVAPGETHVVSPSLHWSEGAYRALVASDHLEMELKWRPALTQSSDAVSATLDAVVFDDGTFLGPNQSHLFERFRLERKAQRDELKRVAQLLKDGRSDDDIRLALETQVLQGRSVAHPIGPDLYAAALGRQALRLLVLLDNYGRDQLIASSSGFTAQERRP